MKKTPLYDDHLRLGGKIVEFAGWQMPVQYSGVVAEHVAVRERVGLFDVSHMGEIWVTGPNAEKALEHMTCNKVSSLYDGKAHYSAILNEKGGVVDDIIIYRCSKERFLVCVNASNADKDYEWFIQHNPTDAKIVNASAEYGQIAVQGPRALELVTPLVKGADLSTLKYFHFVECEILNSPVIVARTGYTGEDGFEILLERSEGIKFWRQSMARGISPCGLGARDTLRLEAGMHLYGRDKDSQTTPLDVGLGWLVNLEMPKYFVGREALEQQVLMGTMKRLVGIKVEGRAIPRMGCNLFKEESSSDEEPVGQVTSGSWSPSLSAGIALALAERDRVSIAKSIFVEIRGKRYKAEICRRPFYERNR
jgi:aminomethyltransferase